jgi:purine catabolism regulator
VLDELEARGVRWGMLVALPGPAHPAGRTTVLQLAATALALARLADGPQAWAELPARELVDAVVSGRHAGESDVAARLQAAGLPVRGRVLGVLIAEGADAAAVGALLAALTAGGASGGADASRSETAGGLGAAAGAGSSGAMPFAGGRTGVSGAFASTAGRDLDVRALGAVHGGDGVVLLSASASPGAALLRRASEASGIGIAMGPDASTVAELLASVRPTRLLAAHLRAGEVRRVDDRPLTRLVTELGGDHRLQEHSERMLAPLIRHDEQHDGDLVRVLRAVVSHPGSRTAAASASHLSRSVFYQRIALIADLLGADLDDGETLSALHLALLASGR